MNSKSARQQNPSGKDIALRLSKMKGRYKQFSISKLFQSIPQLLTPLKVLIKNWVTRRRQNSTPHLTTQGELLILKQRAEPMREHLRDPDMQVYVEWIIEWSRIYLVRLHRQVQPGISVFHSVLWRIHVRSCHVFLCGFWWWFSLKKLSLFMFSWYLDECSSHGKWFWKAKCTVDFLALDF